MLISPRLLRVGRACVRPFSLLVLCGLATNLWASGWPPFTRTDYAAARQGGIVEQLVSGAASVLDNDFDFERDKLTAILDKDVEHGTLILREDGTFRYEHDGGDSDEDSFAYRAFDGTGYSRRTSVFIEIEEVPNSPPYVVEPVPNQEAVEGMSFSLEVADHFADPDDNDVLRFGAEGLPQSGSLRVDATTGILSGTPVSADVRTRPYLVEITATDRAGEKARLTFELTVRQADRGDAALAIRIPANPISVGETLKWEIDIENTGPGKTQAGMLAATWATSAPSLSLTVPDFCTVSDNITNSPEMSCGIGTLNALEILTIHVEGMQDGAGDSSLIAILSVDDSAPDNNADLASAQVVAQFSEGPTQTVGLPGFDVDASDINGDDKVDIVATGEQTWLFFNDGNRAVTTPGTSLGSDSGGTAVALLDWNGDGWMDIAVGGLATYAAKIFVNDTTGGFDRAEQLRDAGVGMVLDMVASDLDNDGSSDLVLTGSSGTVILHSDKQGGFKTVSLTSGAGLDVTSSDIDQDGDRDIVVVRQSDRALDIHYNMGDGSAFDRVRLTYGSVATVAIVDLNGDSATDLLLGTDGADLSIPQNKVLYQQPDGSFVSGDSFGASSITALLSGDVNADGWPDIFAINKAGVHQLYLGDAVGGLTLASEQIVSAGMRRGILADFNGDGSMDLIMIGPNADVLEIHANNGIGRLGLGDRIAPDLQLIGPATVDLTAGEEYVDPGATAVDDIDGDITSQIEVSGTIDATAIGTQTLTYGVSDRAGNTATVIRTVYVDVNQGTGGGGGGAMSLLCLVALVFSMAKASGRYRRPSTPRSLDPSRRRVRRFIRPGRRASI